jgi:hypothetical protein
MNMRTLQVLLSLVEDAIEKHLDSGNDDAMLMLELEDTQQSLEDEIEAIRKDSAR